MQTRVYPGDVVLTHKTRGDKVHTSAFVALRMFGSEVGGSGDNFLACMVTTGPLHPYYSFALDGRQVG